jgi:shikimate dehydrogenase
MESPRPAIYLIGRPVQHSLSAAMQNAALAHLGIDAHYSAWDVGAEELEEVMAFLRDPAVLGANITLPYKVDALRWMDEQAPSARAVGAVNTVEKRAGRLIAHNTDAEGFERAIRRSGDSLSGKHMLVLGASGAARAVLATLPKYRLASLTLLNRDVAKAEATLGAARLTAFPTQVGRLDPEAARAALARCDLLVNATSVGLDGRSSPVPPDSLQRRHTVFDLVYGQTDTPLIAAARQAGARTIGGLTMLLFQGAAAFSIWTRRPAPVDVMRGALQRAAAIPVA